MRDESQVLSLIKTKRIAKFRLFQGNGYRDLPSVSSSDSLYFALNNDFTILIVKSFQTPNNNITNISIQLKISNLGWHTRNYFLLS